MNPGGRILALGGHEFDRRSGNDADLRPIVELADSSRPRDLPAADGERRPRGPDRALPARVRRARLRAERDLAVPARRSSRSMLREHLLAQDVIYVGGGSMVNLIAIWRAHGLDRDPARVLGGGDPDLRAERRRDVLVRAAASPAPRASPRVAEGLGLLPGSACVHYLTEPLRRRALPARGRLGRDAARARARGPDRRAVRGPAPGRDDRRSRGRRGLARDRRPRTGVGGTGREEPLDSRRARGRAPGDRRHAAPRSSSSARRSRPAPRAAGAARGRAGWTRARRRRRGER